MKFNQVLIIMNILAINGSPLKERGNTNIILMEFLKGARAAGANAELIYLSDLDIRACLGKLICWVKTPGMCCQKDDMTSVMSKLKASDVWVFASPLYWDGVSGPMKNLMDRLLPLIEPQITLVAGHCRHALRKGVLGGKIVFISTCGFWEMDNFEPALKHIMNISKNIHRDFSGALLRPHGALLKYMDKSDPMMLDILGACRTAGQELVSNGIISQQTQVRVSKDMMTREEYIKKINDNMDGLLRKNKV